MQTVYIKNPQDAYRRQGILTASPLELIIMLYDGLKKNIMLGQRAIEKKNIEGAHNYFMKAQAIVTELVNALNMDVPLSEELFRIYEFILDQLEEINLKKDTAPVAGLLEIVSTLRDTWQEVHDGQKGLPLLGEAQGE